MPVKNEYTKGYSSGRVNIITELGLWVDENIENLYNKISTEKGEQNKLILKGILSGYKQFRNQLNRKVLRMKNRNKL